VRCFVALDLPQPVCVHLAQVVQPLRARFDVKWVPADQMHATLVFAGDLPPAAGQELAEFLDTLPLGPLALHLDRLGHFPPRGVPRVIWAGLAGDVDGVSAVQRELAACAEALGVPRERRPFTPHVTLGRVRSHFGAFALVDELARVSEQINAKPFAATAVTLYESELGPGGPDHRVLVRRTLARPRGDAADG
jgi:2'-5' RNA ligase